MLICRYVDMLICHANLLICPRPRRLGSVFEVWRWRQEGTKGRVDLWVGPTLRRGTAAARGGGVMPTLCGNVVLDARSRTQGFQFGRDVRINIIELKRLLGTPAQPASWARPPNPPTRDSSRRTRYANMRICEYANMLIC